MAVTQYFLGFCWVIILGVLLNSTVLEPTDRFKVNVQHTAYLASIKGFMQTPIGGMPGTSDEQRPSFAELGIKRVQIGETRINLYGPGINFYAEYQQIKPKSKGFLAQPLRSYGEQIPANTVINTDNSFNGYRIGIVFPISITHRLQWTPKFEVALLDFDYHFKTRILDKHRGYHHLTLRFGEGIYYQITPHLTFNIEQIASLPLFRVLNIKNTTLGFTYKTVATRLFKQYLDFEDGQRLPNHLVLDSKGMTLNTLQTH